MRVPRDEFRSLGLEVHGILSDVPLHDVSAIDLPGGGAGRTISDVRSLLAGVNLRAANPAVAHSSRCVHESDGCVAGTPTFT